MRREEQRAGVHHGWPEGLAAEGHESLARAAEPRSPPRARRGKTTRRSGGGGGCSERGWGTRAGRGRRARVCVCLESTCQLLLFQTFLCVCLFFAVTYAGIQPRGTHAQVLSTLWQLLIERS